MADVDAAAADFLLLFESLAAADGCASMDDVVGTTAVTADATDVDANGNDLLVDGMASDDDDDDDVDGLLLSTLIATLFDGPALALF